MTKILDKNCALFTKNALKSLFGSQKKDIKAKYSFFISSRPQRKKKSNLCIFGLFFDKKKQYWWQRDIAALIQRD